MMRFPCDDLECGLNAGGECMGPHWGGLCGCPASDEWEDD